MNNYIENKINYNQISFRLTSNASIEEREIHSYHEILLFMEDSAQLLTKDGQYELKNCSVIVVPAETYHFFRLTQPKTFKRLKISFPDYYFKDDSVNRVMSDIKVFENLNGNIYNIFERLYHILKENSDSSSFYAYSAFLMLISELDMSYNEKAANNYTKKNGIMAKVMEYISENLSKNLNVNSLSEKFFISSSTITHEFKKEFGISVHKYVLQKRLIMAKRLIQEGKQLSQICADVGFMDYSSFYKAYTRFFGYPPSKEKEKNAHL